MTVAAQHRRTGPDLEMKEPTYTIAELSRDFDITPRTIRHYEDQGLLFPERSGSQRIYTRRDHTRLKLTLRGKRLGLSLAEIKDLIDMYDTARDESSQLTKFLTVLTKRKASLEQQREDIEAVLAEINGFEQQSRRILEGKRRPAKSGSRRAA
jgi:DNA-binding transcriptional MerR regulator